MSIVQELQQLQQLHHLQQLQQLQHMQELFAKHEPVGCNGGSGRIPV